jgi:hypothetical protein
MLYNEFAKFVVRMRHLPAPCATALDRKIRKIGVVALSAACLALCLIAERGTARERIFVSLGRSA